MSFLTLRLFNVYCYKIQRDRGCQTGDPCPACGPTKNIFFSPLQSFSPVLTSSKITLWNMGLLVLVFICYVFVIHLQVICNMQNSDVWPARGFEFDMPGIEHIKGYKKTKFC